ncbi:MAG: hypothetical protein IPI63_04045 [Methanothrix sp.]|uniref:hypothetical protein n=1 Tax=Methanothrix sp. TaxID=90426 RepID=UPI0025F6A950|nr:hypothetical protein [Methanothrix sp.]MBK7385927.1 hypothetical protein [Methanothrix sp.]
MARRPSLQVGGHLHTVAPQFGLIFKLLESAGGGHSNRLHRPICPPAIRPCPAWQAVPELTTLQAAGFTGWLKRFQECLHNFPRLQIAAEQLHELAPVT